MWAPAYRLAVLAEVGKARLEQVLAFYPPAWPKSAENVRSLGRLSSDRMLCGARRRLAWLQRAPNSTGKAFLYRFDYYYRDWPPFEPGTHRSTHWLIPCSHRSVMTQHGANALAGSNPNLTLTLTLTRLQPALHGRAQLPRT